MKQLKKKIKKIQSSIKTRRTFTITNPHAGTAGVVTMVTGVPNEHSTIFITDICWNQGEGISVTVSNTSCNTCTGSICWTFSFISFD